LAELSLVRDHIMEPPVLLLDDVLAELDLSRQSHLMQACDQDMQTLITTTHVDAFEKKWLLNARFIEIKEGRALEQEEEPINN
ncbi:MAG TPA: DNA replication and repair protein RecF, partial [Candidatus Melainabacteria bacterium]|nr:DNA replication and repair protein RecF [Candidatus Melainabacteria bacterium]